MYFEGSLWEAREKAAELNYAAPESERYIVDEEGRDPNENSWIILQEKLIHGRWMKDTEFSDYHQERWITRPAIWLGWAIAIVGGIWTASLVFDGIHTSAYFGDQSQIWLNLGVVTAFTFGLIGLLYITQTIKREAAGVLAVVFLIIFGYAWYGEYKGRHNTDNMVYDYCAYGSRSVAQLAGCIDHVTPGQAEYAETPAGKMARGGTDCGVGAGPFCRDVALGHEAEQALQELNQP
jgi:hypothetical protein